MDDDIRLLAMKLLNQGYDDLPAREQRVLRQIARRAHVAVNVNELFRDKQTFGQRLADRVAAVGGSWGFIIGFGLVLAVWIGLNLAVLGQRAFDPYPFIFLNLILSMLAAIQAPIIMMSQNRQAAKDRLMAAHDYEVNLKAELEILGLHEKMDDVRQQKLEHLIATQNQQLDMLRILIAARAEPAAPPVS